VAKLLSFAKDLSVIIMPDSSTPATGRQLELFRIIDRYLNHGVPAKLAAVALGLTERQFYRYVQKYQQHGIDGIGRKRRKDKGARKVVKPDFQKIIEGLCLQKPKPTLAWVHRKIEEY